MVRKRPEAENRAASRLLKGNQFRTDSPAIVASGESSKPREPRRPRLRPSQAESSRNASEATLVEEPTSTVLMRGRHPTTKSAMLESNSSCQCATRNVEKTYIRTTMLTSQQMLPAFHRFDLQLR